jgi:hypothetical protein
VLHDLDGSTSKFVYGGVPGVSFPSARNLYDIH